MEVSERHIGQSFPWFRKAPAILLFLFWISLIIILGCVDFRFSIKVFNVPEDFVFRAVDEDSCKEWVATLKSAKDGGSINGSQHSSNSTATTEFPDILGKKEQANGTETKNNHAVFPDLDMNSGLPKPSAPPMNVDNEVNGNSAHSSSNGNNQSASSSRHSSSSAQGASSPKKERLPIKELRAIAHAEGYDTRGMERSDLEKIAAYFAPVSVKNEMFQNQQQQQSRNTNGRASAYNINNTTAAASGSNVDEKRIAAEVERIRKHQEEERMRREQEYLNQKQEEERRRNEELQKQTVAAKRREAEKVKQSQQRKQWQNQKQQQTNKNEPASKSYNFESSRFFDNSAGGVSGPRRKQPTPTSNTNDTHFAPQSNQTRVKQDPPAQRRHPQQQPQPQRTAFNQQRPAHNNSAAPPPPLQQKQNTAHGSPTNTNSQRSSDPTSPLNQKYAKVMANNQGDDSTGNDQATITTIKRNILITWALVPPQYNMLRTIDQLLTSIQTVFPPFSNVASHEYFAKWKIIRREEFCLSSTMGNSPDEVKLKKGVRKLRVLLHPDRLPREFDAKQTFVCKMLWDVTNDAYEEFLKQKDDLDWIHK